MLNDRRNLLKMMALSPFFYWANRLVGQSITDTIPYTLPGGADINLVFHGFFFFEAQDGQIAVAAPFNKDHFFLYRDQGEDELHDMPDFKMTYPQLKPNASMPDWPEAIMNFSKRDLSVKGPLLPDTYSSNKLGCLMILPFPKKIVAIRFGGTTDEFKLEGNIAKFMKLPSDKNLGLITCLQYDKQADMDFAARHFYAEHCAAPGNAGLITLFQSAKDGFGSPFKDTFDLKMTQTKTISAELLEKYRTTRKKMAALDDDDYNDEAALRELRYVKHNPCKPFETAADRFSIQEAHKHGQGHGHGYDATKTVEATLIRTANCPQFGIVS